MDSSTRNAVKVGIATGIISGIIATVLYVRILDPLFFSYLPSKVLLIAEAISQRWADTIFRDAAQPMSTEGLVLILVALGFGLIGVWLLPKVERRGASTEKIMKGVMAGAAALMMVLIFLLGAMRDTSSSLDRCFRSRVAVLSPHLSDRESKQLIARWTLMHSQAEFDAITQQLREYAQKYDVQSVLKSVNTMREGRCVKTV